jgi:L-alanine-DL-glutamate epimerase-like enolase superfamily enzyme
MRITSVDVVPYALSFAEPYATALGRLERREMVLVRLRTDQGVEGLGEAVPMALRGGPSLAQVVRELRD